MKSTLNIHWKDWCWSWSSNSLATWCEELIHLKRLWFWKRLRAGEELGNRGWDGWITSLAQWTWVEKTPGDGEDREGWHGCSPWSYKKSYILRDWTTTNNSFINMVNYIGWCFNKCTQVWFTYLKIINFKCMVWWVLGNIHCCATTVTNYCPQFFLLPLAVHSSSYSRLWATSEMLSVWVILLFLEILYKRNHKICCFLCPFPHGKEQRGLLPTTMKVSHLQSRLSGLHQTLRWL